MKETVSDKIMKPVGLPVRFKYPKGEGKRKMFLVKRDIAATYKGKDNVVFWCVVDTIRVEKERTSPWLRVGYYREKPKGKLRWAGQTTIVAPLTEWNKIIAKINRALNKVD